MCWRGGACDERARASDDRRLAGTGAARPRRRHRVATPLYGRRRHRLALAARDGALYRWPLRVATPFWPNLAETAKAFAIALVISIIIGLVIGFALGFHRLPATFWSRCWSVLRVPKITLYPIPPLLRARHVGEGRVRRHPWLDPDRAVHHRRGAAHQAGADQDRPHIEVELARIGVRILFPAAHCPKSSPGCASGSRSP